MKQYTIEELQEIIAKDYGFQKELIKNPEVCGLWHIRFEVNGIELYGSTPYAGAAPRLKVTGYTAKHTWHGGPITDEYYEEVIKGQKLVLRHCIDPDSGDWEELPKFFDTVEEAEEYIAGLDNSEVYDYDIASLYGIIDPEAIIEKMEGEELLWKKSQYQRN